MRQYSQTRKTALLSVLGVLLALSLPAQNVGWHDRMTLQVGDGVALNRQQEAAFPGLMSSLTLPVTTTYGWSESYSFAQHTYDMVSSVSANVAVSLNSLVFGGDVNVSFFGRHTFDANDLTFIYTASPGSISVTYDAAIFSSNFWNQAALYQKTLKDAALHRAIISTFGTHYVSGYQATRLIVVVYSFHYASASNRQQSSLSANAGGGLGPIGDVNFSTYVNNFFASTNTSATMSYDFWSSDPTSTNNLSFVSAGVIRNVQDFTTFLGQVRSYAMNMDISHAKITGYTLSPIQTAAGYSSLFSPSFQVPTVNPANYNVFMQAYAALQVWKQHFDPWILSGDTMNWLNAQGRQHVLSQWFNADSYLATLKAIAAGHFTTNAPLTLPADIANYLTTLNDISLPRIYYITSFSAVSSTNYMLGLVDCGCSDLTTAIPFNNLSELYYGTNIGRLLPIYYSPQAFENAALTAYSSGTVHTDLQSFFAGATGGWLCLSNAAYASGHRYGFFLAAQSTSQTTNWSLVVSSGTDANGNALEVDEMRMSDTTRNASCPVSAPCTITITNLAGTNLTSVPLYRPAPERALLAAVEPDDSLKAAPLLFQRHRKSPAAIRARTSAAPNHAATFIN